MRFRKPCVRTCLTYFVKSATFFLLVSDTLHTVSDTQPHLRFPNMKKTKSQSTQKGNTRYTFRLPVSLLAKLKIRAKNSSRSVAGEVVNALRQIVEA